MGRPIAHERHTCATPAITYEDVFQGHTVKGARAGIPAQGLLACAHAFYQPCARHRVLRREGGGMYLDRIGKCIFLIPKALIHQG